MLELLLCSMLTVLPDYLYRRYVQGKRLGREINLYTVWFELRWGITACLVLTVSLITLIFYYHPSTKNVTAIFRTVTILPEAIGRVAEVYVDVNEKVEAGQPLFRLDDAEQEAAVETARRRIAEVEAETVVAETELADRGRPDPGGAERAAAGAGRARRPGPSSGGAIPTPSPLREIERLQVVVDGRQGSLDAALASKATQQTRIASPLPAQKASAEAALAQAQVELDKTLVRAGVDGTVQQFTLRPGDVVNPMMRAGRHPGARRAGAKALIAGFGQIEAQVMKVGMIAEATCIGQALHHHSDGGDRGAGRHRRRPVPADRPADRRPADGAAGDDHRLPRAALSRAS